MDGQEGFVMEVQIRKSRSHLPRLRRIVSCAAAGTGMCRRDVDDMESAVNEVCLGFIEAAFDQQSENLSVCLAAQGECMTVEILGGISKGCDAPDCGSFITKRLARICELTDTVAHMVGEEGTTIRLIKYARKAEPSLNDLKHHLPAWGTSSLQV
jgi:hypothetical protein